MYEFKIKPETPICRKDQPDQDVKKKKKSGM